MRSRVLWSATGALALAGLAVVLGTGHAQRPGGGGGGFTVFGPQSGRFAVAHASAEAVLVLDTATGQVYRAGRDDFKKMSDLPRVEDRRPPFFDKERPFGKGGDKKDVDRPRKEREKRDRDREGDEQRERKEGDGRERKERGGEEKREGEGRD